MCTYKTVCTHNAVYMCTYKIVCTHGAVYICTLHLCEYVTDLINILAVCRVIVGNVFVNVGVSRPKQEGYKCRVSIKGN